MPCWTRSPRSASSTWIRRRRRNAFGARSALPAMDRGILSAEHAVAARARTQPAGRIGAWRGPAWCPALCATDHSAAMLECARGSCPMPECFVAKASEMQEGDRRIVVAGNAEIGVFYKDGAYFAYSNTCVHAGGPACEGLMINRVVDVI